MDILISNGCSFSECRSIDCWPLWAANDLDMRTVVDESEFWQCIQSNTSVHISLGLSSQGNGQIYRRTQNIIAQLVAQGIELSRVGVVVQWSGPDRWDYYAESASGYLKRNIDGWRQNPVHWPPSDSTGGGWVIQNASWRNSLAQIYYRTYHSSAWAQIQTMEQLIALQSLCATRGIRFYSFSYLNSVFNNHSMSHPQVVALSNLVEWNTVDCTGQWQWVEKNVGVVPENRKEYRRAGVAHPTPDQHQRYASEWVVPRLVQAWAL